MNHLFFEFSEFLFLCVHVHTYVHTYVCLHGVIVIITTIYAVLLASQIFGNLYKIIMLLASFKFVDASLSIVVARPFLHACLCERYVVRM